MKNQLPKDIMYKKIAWTIKGFSKLQTEYLFSEVFTFGDSAWKVRVFPKGYRTVDHLSIGLEVADAASLPKGWSIYAEYRLVVVNQVSRKSSVENEYKLRFSAEGYNWGFPYFMPLSTLHDPYRGFILNDTCIIEVEWLVLKSEGISRDLSGEYELIDFRGLGQIEKVFVPLLEEVCLWHPSLAECQKKRTRRFTEWAFTTLGRVLHFLKTKKGKDVIESEDAREHLRNLWEELEICRFDLTWLEPHVQSALGMKKAYVEKAEQEKKLKENLLTYETEMKKLRENQVALNTGTEKLKVKLANTEEKVEKVRKDLAKAQEGFEERDMNAEIGYGKGKH